jgi:HEAT repeat protein
MSVGSLVVLLAALPAGPVPPAPTAPSPTLSSPDEQTLTAAHIPVGGPGLLDFLHKRSSPSPDKAQIAGLVKQLGDQVAATRDAASAQLTSIGEAAVPVLREAANNLDDPDFAGRARQCLQNIEGPQAANLSMAVARAVAALKPAGGADALLGFLPFAENDKVSQEVETALAAVALRDGKPESALVRALTDAAPARRAAAAVALCRVGGEDQLPAVRELLKDPKPTVRFRAAMALADAYSADGIPVMIDLLSELPTEQRKQAEEYLTALAGEWAVAGPAGNDATSRKLRREAWNAWWHGIDDKVLLDEFKSRTMTDEERDQALALIQKLDDVSAEVREKASTDLVGLGLRVTPLLRQAAVSTNPRIGPFALKCLQLIEKGSPNPLPAAAGRMLAMRAPDGAVATLLAYLPYADSADSGEQLRDLLSNLAVHDARAVPVLLKALDEKIPVRRSAAAVALVRRGGADNLAAVKKLFKDADPDVRFRTAMAVLTAARDKDSVPVLIALLAELPQDKVWQAEETLVFIAGDKAPAVSMVGDAEARKKASEAWVKWWADNNASVDLAKLDLTEQRELGYVLITENNFPGKNTGRIAELDAGGQVRWQIDNASFPQDAVATNNNHVILIDNNGMHVAEREIPPGNKIIWEKNLPQQAFRVQRLANGNTFVACRNGLLEYDRTGKEVLNQQRPNEWLFDAQKLPDGQIVLLNNAGRYTRIGADGKEAKAFNVPQNILQFGMNGAAALPNDHVLVASWQVVGNVQGKVTELDADGKTVMEAGVMQPNNFYRLPNGHTLVTCQNQTHVVELDKTGKIVNDMKDLQFRPWRVSRR